MQTSSLKKLTVSNLPSVTKLSASLSKKANCYVEAPVNVGMHVGTGTPNRFIRL